MIPGIVAVTKGLNGYNSSSLIYPQWRRPRKVAQFRLRHVRNRDSGRFRFSRYGDYCTLVAP